MDVAESLFPAPSEAKCVLRWLHLVRIVGAYDEKAMRGILEMREGRVQGQPDLENPWHPIQLIIWQVCCLAVTFLSLWLLL